MRTLTTLALTAAGTLAATALTRARTPMPPGLNTYSTHHPGTAHLLTDLTYQRPGIPGYTGTPTVHDHTIMPTIMGLINRAQHLLILDLFLFNDGTAPGTNHPPLTQQLTNALLTKRHTHPNLPIILITDPINTFYGSYTPPHLHHLQQAGVHVTITNLAPLPDSNPAYSTLYRTLLRHLPHTPHTLPNALIPDGPKTTPAGYAALFNFKANHRKVALNETEAVISSANPHDASAPNSNLGLHITGPALADIFASERAVFELSGGDPALFPSLEQHLATDAPAPSAATPTLQLITEGGIHRAVLETLAAAQPGSTVYLGMFYLSERRTITALKDAAARGVTVQAILDLNIDAFGRKKTGLPAQPVAAELADAGVQVRWYATHGEQFHPKVLAVQDAGRFELIAGSGNFTRRNLCNYNLETSLRVRTGADSDLAQEFTGYWDLLWNNRPVDGAPALFTKDYEKPSGGAKALAQKLIYRVQEATGISTF